MNEDAISLSGIKPGDKVAILLPRKNDLGDLLCKIVGDAGRVYLISLEISDVAHDSSDACRNVVHVTLHARTVPAPELYNSSDDPGAVYEYYSRRLPIESFVTPEPLDSIWIEDRYREIHSGAFGNASMPRVFGALRDALQPDGVLMILEAKLSDREVTPKPTTDRVRPASTKQTVVDSAFEFLGETVRSEAVLMKFRKQ